AGNPNAMTGPVHWPLVQYRWHGPVRIGVADSCFQAGSRLGWTKVQWRPVNLFCTIFYLCAKAGGTQQPGRSAMCFRSGEIVLATNPIKGKADPRAPNDTAAGWAQNRPSS